MRSIFWYSPTATRAFTAAVVMVAVLLGDPIIARAETAAVVPTAITTASGSTGGNQRVSNLAVQDLSGTTDNWNKYVEFGGQYSGYLSYSVPAGISPASIGGIQVLVNYRGPATATQTWTFMLYDWTTGSWSTIGSNAGAPDWGSWKRLVFTAAGTPARYVSSGRSIRLRLVANNAKDAADIDYAAVLLTSATTADTMPPSTPAKPVVTGTTSSSVSLSWAAATDNVAVTGYEVFQGTGTTPAAVVSGASATVGGLSASTAYSFTVKARDAAGNASAASAVVTASTAAASGGLPAPVTCPGCWHPQAQVSWDWVLARVPAAPYRGVQMYDIDGFDATAADVTALHGAGIKAVCYISVGSYENWRPDTGQFPAAILGNNLDGWAGERWLDVRDVQQAGSALAQIMNARLNMCANKGFDAVEFDNMDGYTNSTGFPLTASQQAQYNVFLANGAHQRGLSAMMKNDLDQVSALLPYFDMILNEECNAYDECGALSKFVQAGKPVFNAEYGSSTGFCAADNAANFNGVNFALDLDGSKFQPCR